VRWSRGGLRWKVILVSFLYIYNKYVFFKVPVLFDLPWYVYFWDQSHECLTFALTIRQPISFSFIV
jgi:hypothetical protein